jgi:hypothetical protein
MWKRRILYFEVDSASKLGMIPKVQIFEKENKGLMEAFTSL